MSFNAVIKKNARAALKGHWPGAAGISALLALFWAGLVGLETIALYILTPADLPAGDLAELVAALFMPGYLEGAVVTGLSLIAFFLFTPLTLGFARWHYLLVQDERPEISALFYFFENGRRYARAIGYAFQLSLRAGGWAVAFLSLPGGLMVACVRLLRIEEITRQLRAAASLGVLLAIGLFLLAGILYAIFLGRYALVVYQLCESDALSLRQAFRDSVSYTKDYLGTLFLLHLTFVGWFLLALPTLLLSLLHTVPYHTAARTVFARYLIEKNRMTREEIAGTREFGKSEV
ncbi:MAG: DUF975 family protein [Oscillospiraceae bacterium]|nr:DUF975 family protein [Oscillospiraceae bacterium]